MQRGTQTKRQTERHTEIETFGELLHNSHKQTEMTDSGERHTDTQTESERQRDREAKV